MYLWLTLAFLFFIGSVLGWVLELLFRNLTHRQEKLVNPGFCTGPYLKMTNRGDSWYWAIDYSGWRQDIEFNEVLPADTQYDVPFTELDMQDIGEN